MKTTSWRRAVVAWALLALGGESLAQPVGTAFTYQGRLTDAGLPASGTYDLQLVLFDAASGGSQVGPLLTRDDVVVTNGLFTVTLDFGSVFAGDKGWLQLGVRAGSSTGAYTALSPRQELTPSPNAAFSSATPWTGVTGKPAGFADNTDDDVLGGLTCANGQVAKWSGLWACAADADSGGDVTGVNAGTGLTGGGASGDVTLNVDLSGSGSATSVSRSDHDHSAQAWSAAVPSQPSLRVVNTGSGGFSDGIWGQGDSAGGGRGVVGYASATSGQNFGVWGQTDSSAGRGVFGLATSTGGGAIGVLGETHSFGYAVRGNAIGVGIGVAGVSDGNVGVWGFTNSGGLAGVLGDGGAPNMKAVYGRSLGSQGTTYAIYGEQNQVATSYAGYFAGRAHVTGTLSKGGGAFKIDHPLDPENKYLYHSFVESPDMKNIYDGVVTTDGDGFATVELPEWFEALNRDFRYQLTVIGQFAQAIVARKIEENRFTIQTDKPDVEVSWQVTGIRKDPFAEKHRIPVEEQKPDGERGTYLHPEEWGRPRETGLDHQRRLQLPGDSGSASVPID